MIICVHLCKVQLQSSFNEVKHGAIYLIEKLTKYRVSTIKRPLLWYFKFHYPTMSRSMSRSMSRVLATFTTNQQNFLFVWTVLVLCVCRLAVIPVFLVALTVTSVLVLFPRSPETPPPFKQIEVSLCTDHTHSHSCSYISPHKWVCCTTCNHGDNVFFCYLFAFNTHRHVLLYRGYCIVTAWCTLVEITACFSHLIFSLFSTQYFCQERPLSEIRL